MTANRLAVVALVIAICVGVGMYTSPDVNERAAWGAATILALVGLSALTIRSDDKGQSPTPDGN
jgi:hypothetical protein